MTKRKYILALAALAALPFAACDKELAEETAPANSNRIPIRMEKFEVAGDSKMTVQNGDVVLWHDGDSLLGSQVGIKYNLTVSIEDGIPYISLPTSNPNTYGTFHGVFGADIYYQGSTTYQGYSQKYSMRDMGGHPGGSGGDGKPVYYSTYEADGQHLALPMVGYKSRTASEISFFHVTAAVNMLIWNPTDKPLYVDTLTVESATDLLHYSVLFTTLTDTECEYIRYSSSGHKKVSVIFRTPAEIPAGEQVTLQVPIMPLPAGSGDLTLGVKAHHLIPGKTSGGVLKHSFSHTGAAPTGGLARNQVLLAKIKFDPSASSKIATQGLFSVSADKQVVFSRGNLLWYYGSQLFTFWEEQYMYLGSNGVNNTMSTTDCANATDKRQDLFHYGSSGKQVAGAGSYPYNPGARKEYDLSSGCYKDHLAGTLADWGNGYPINSTGKIGGESFGTGWRTLTKDEWVYLFDRTASDGVTKLHNSVKLDRSSGFNIATTSVSDPWAVILYPDNWEGGLHGNSDLSGNGNILTLEQWRKYEAKGAVLLPAAGYRRDYDTRPSSTTTVQNQHKYGYYWSASTTSPTNDAYTSNILWFLRDRDEPTYYPSWTQRRGNALSVRLVKDF